MCDFSGCNSVFQLHTKYLDYLDYLQNVRLNLKILELHRTINFVERNLLSKQIEKIVEKEEERRYEKFITKSNILEKYQNVFHNIKNSCIRSTNLARLTIWYFTFLKMQLPDWVLPYFHNIECPKCFLFSLTDLDTELDPLCTECGYILKNN